MTMNIVNVFLKSLTIPVADLAKWLEEEHQIPIQDTITKWNELTHMQVVIDNEDNSITCQTVVDQTVQIEKTTNQQKSRLNPVLCQHVFIVGTRKGQQCTTKPKSGNNRCGAHKSKAEKSKKKRTSRVKSNTIVKSDSESDDHIANPQLSESDSEVSSSKNKSHNKIADDSGSDDDE